MDLILFSKSSSSARHVKLAAPILVAALATVVVLAGSGFALGYFYAQATGQAGLEPLASELKSQRNTLDGVRRGVQDQVNALGLQLGELQASVTRLNALGRRLTSIAGLDDGEFDFEEMPALGGPEDTDGMMPYAAPELVADIDALAARLQQQEKQLILVQSVMSERKVRSLAQPQGRPVRKGWVSSSFGRRVDPFTGQPARHLGVDFAAPPGTEIYAVAAGVVTWSGRHGAYGNMIEISHGNGYVTRYAHNKENLVEAGDYVKPGEMIGLMGDTGRATGSHLHFEVLHEGRQVDPMRYLRTRS